MCGCTLILNFMMNYETAIQNQRNTQWELDKASKKALYKINTRIKSLYKYIIFKVQKEICKASFSIHTRMLVLKMGGKFTLCNITTVKANLKIYLSCEHFKRMGVLCKHAFTIMMRCGVKEIPESFESCLDIVGDDKKKLALFGEKQQMLLKEFESKSDYTFARLKCKTDSEVVCKLMVQSNTGFGIKKKISSAGEVSYENSKKEHSMCLGCGKRVPQNLRTFPIRISVAQSTKDI
uniref:Protein FAR1-RELATED SEQUENCE n=1 Tax=Lactuca sativa TaxID=4236 RepID=A0A9R1VNV1_LACSA|nr:hypothetical protein LSAT_V11C500233490 [Lactuca sativa]